MKSVRENSGKARRRESGEAGATDAERWAYELAHETASRDLTPIVGQNLRRLRTKRGLSLERLSRKAGVSRAMLGQVELGQSTPTINVLWKIAVALDVPFSTLISSTAVSASVLLPRDKAKVLMSHDGAFSSRALFPFDAPRSCEFYELRLAAGKCEKADAHAPGTSENIVVVHGLLELQVGREVYRVGEGDAVQFQADQPHAYTNPGSVETLMYLVMAYTTEKDS